jgi:hypothetical protein
MSTTLFTLALLATVGAEPHTLTGVHGGTATMSELPGHDLPLDAPCTLQLWLSAQGAASVQDVSCGGAVEISLRAAVPGWRFDEVLPAPGQERVELLLELQPGPEGTPWTLRAIGGPPVPGGVTVGSLDQVAGVDPSGQAPGAEDEAKAVALSTIKVRKRVSPKMPEEAKMLGDSEARCQLRFFIDERGRPYDLKTEECPEIYRASALEAGWQWRFEPLEIDGEAVKAQFVLVIVYRLTS